MSSVAAEVIAPIDEPAPLTGTMLYHIGGTGNAERVDVSDLFVNRLAKQGLQVDYVLFDRQIGPAWQITTWRKNRAYVVGTSPRSGLLGAIDNKLKQAWADVQTVRLALSGRYDIVQIRDRHFVTPLAWLATKLRGKKFVLWCSYPYAESRLLDAQEGRAKLPWASYLHGKIGGWLLYRWSMPRADQVFVQSEQMRQDIAHYGVPMAHMTPVPMAVDEALLELNTTVCEPFAIAYLGTMIRVRRLDFLVDVLAKVRAVEPRAHLYFIGDAEEPGDRQLIQDKIDSAGLTRHVTITGMLDMHTAQTKTAQAAVCVSPFYATPILRSTSPTKMCEYMALGRPVVANHHPEQTRMIQASGAGLCVNWDVDEFAAAILKILLDPALAQDMGRRGKIYVEQHRTYARIAQDITPIYQALLNR